ncbi:BID domain-containing T4SS effector [Bartonella sp. AR 15-3]|uniref:BID domain-containing T4SS effector n=1 Tax=Bartonella sp. AR 15-3 TaxID=545617 RepID=UPI0001F4CC32|nr:BID domain-containing T4SS effector [Bartonella sp. AR 15-3]OPB31844.1 Bartonella effector protein Bep4 [Bartonella sp. AR 15-3]CBI79119.1 Bartonella effector protein (Bep); substrate of VirB T4SS [Bartonella sp. AR 15-3]
MFKRKIQEQAVSKYASDYAIPRSLMIKRRATVNSVISACMLEGYILAPKTLDILKKYASGDYSLKQFNTQMDSSVKEVKVRKKYSTHGVITTNGMLVNKYGITDAVALHKRSAHDIAKAIVNLSCEEVPEQFDSSYLKCLHKRLFGNMFEWAGQTRDEISYLEDIKKTKLLPMEKLSSVSSKEIQERFKKIDKILFEKNNLKDLSCEEFSHNVARIFSLLNDTYPFISGNECTQMVFFEQLAQVANYKLDFSVITKERMKLVSDAAKTLKGNIGDLAPIEHFFEDVSDPNKVCMLKEFIKNNKCQDKNIKNQIIVAPRKDIVYGGICRNWSSNAILVETEDAYVVCHKDYLMAEELKTLKLGDKMSFTAVIPEDFGDILIPEGVLVSLAKEEIIKRVKKDSFVQRSLENVEYYSRVVYDDSEILKKNMEFINEFVCFDTQVAKRNTERLVDKIMESPQSIHVLAGVEIFGMKNSKRKKAEECCGDLRLAINQYIDNVIYARDAILQQYEAHNSFKRKAVAMPHKEIQDVLNLPENMRQEVLDTSCSLQQEICDFVSDVMKRLSFSEYQALHDNNYEKLAQNLGVSVNKAEKITKLFKAGEKVYLQAKNLKINHSESMAITQRAS